MTNLSVHPGVYTSLSRPSSPVLGTGIIETNTGKELFWYGPSLGWLPDWGVAWGEVAITTITADVSLQGGGPPPNFAADTGIQVAWTAYLNRIYYTELEYQVDVTNGASILYHNAVILADVLAPQGAGVLPNSSVYVNRHSLYGNAGSTDRRSESKVFARQIGISGGKINKVQKEYTSGIVMTLRASVANPAYLRIMDEGSIGPPPY